MPTTSNIYDLTDTWDDGATTFVAIQMDVTDTASAAVSKLIDLQKGSVSQFNVDKNGNLTLTGTVDGRDVAADGSKLDLIEAQADVTDTANVTAAGALMDSEVTNLAQVKAFDSSDYATAAQGSLAGTAVQPNDSPTFATTTLTGQLNGPADFIIDPAVVGNNTGKVTIKGDLQVDGTTTTINSTTLTVDDTEIVVASGAADAATADLAGFRVDGAAATMLYRATGDKWQFNKNIDVQGDVVASGDLDCQDITASATIQDQQGNVRALEVTTDSTTSVTIASGSSGKYFRLTGAATTTININAGNFSAGDIITLHNATASDMTVDFDANFSDTVYIAGDGTDKNNSTITLEAYGLATCTAFTNSGMIVAGNVS